MVKELVGELDDRLLNKVQSFKQVTSGLGIEYQIELLDRQPGRDDEVVQANEFGVLNDLEEESKQATVPVDVVPGA